MDINLGGNACDLSMTVGDGDSALNRWYFDSNTKHCTTFWYKGLRGNANNFLSAEECRRQCAGAYNEVFFLNTLL